MLSLAKSLVAGSEDSPITNLSSAYGEEDDFVTELPPVQQSVLEALEDLFGSLPREEATPVHVQDVGSEPVLRIAFTDAEVMLGKGGRRKKVAAGVGMLFPEMMVA